MLQFLGHLAVLLALSIVGFFIIDLLLIPRCRQMFVTAGLAGVDMAKRDKRKIPEAQGVLCGTVYLMVLSCFIPAAFFSKAGHDDDHSYFDLLEYMSALSTICFMVFLGFADDVLNLPWRVKLILPTVASLPLLTVYAVNINSTTIIVPKPFRMLLGYDLNLGLLYYLYMAMLAVFCTNAINIYAGVNGLEVGQSLVIAVSILLFNACEVTGKFWQGHLLSIYLIIPYFFVSLALFKHNWYPSAVFVGDTFCYFSGMTFAVAGILGHFSKTMLLFFLPQIANFIFSTPQLFHLVPCPRHRLPRYSPVQDKVSVSTTEFRMSSLPRLGRLVVSLFSALRLVRLQPKAGEEGSADPLLECSNLTVLNLMLHFFGPMHERTLVLLLLILQLLSTGVAFGIRYPMASLFYDV